MTNWSFHIRPCIILGGSVTTITRPISNKNSHNTRT